MHINSINQGHLPGNFNVREKKYKNINMTTGQRNLPDARKLLKIFSSIFGKGIVNSLSPIAITLEIANTKQIKENKNSGTLFFTTLNRSTFPK
ncbi:TPA: hypothetical protein ACH74P_005335, partial [Escherichia coli]